jgi:hypothetical protein
MEPLPHPPESTAVRARDAALARLRRVNVLIVSGAVALTGVFVALAAAAPGRKAPVTDQSQTPALQQQDQQVPQDQQLPQDQQGDPFGGGSDDGSGGDQGFDDGGGLTPPSQAPSGSSQAPVAPSGGS